MIEETPYDTNPFPIRSLQPKKFTKKSVERGFVDIETGDVVTVRSLDQGVVVEHDYGSYVKMFPGGLDLVKEASVKEKTLLYFILKKLKPGQSEIELKCSEAVGVHKNLGGGAYYVALLGLKAQKFLARSSRGRHWYFINANYFFNGDRRRIK